MQGKYARLDRHRGSFSLSWHRAARRLFDVRVDARLIGVLRLRVRVPYDFFL